MCSTYSTKPQIKGGGHKKIVDPPTWLRVAIILEMPPAPTHIYMQRVENVNSFGLWSSLGINVDAEDGDCENSRQHEAV